MIPMTEPLLRVRDLPAHAPYAAPLIDLLTNLHDEPGWTVTVRHADQERVAIGLHEWEVSAHAGTHELGKAAAAVLGAHREGDSHHLGEMMWSGTYVADDGTECGVWVHAPRPAHEFLERVRDLVDEADLTGRHQDAETLRVALAELRGGDQR